MENSINIASPDAKTIQSFFDAIPEHYDFLNAFLSLSLDRLWRKKLVEIALQGNPGSILDIGVGTGTSINAFLAAKDFQRAVGCDFSQGMLRVAKQKVRGASLAGADLHALPFQDETFDLVTSSFVLRSVKDMRAFLYEVKRVLTEHGKFVFLDLTRPTNPFFWNCIYRPYLKIYIPLVGKLISKHPTAYQFLSQSIQTFIEPTRLVGEVRSVGFSSAFVQPLSFGAATILIGKK